MPSTPHKPHSHGPRSHGLWEATAPVAPATTALDGHVSADIVIVGGGYTGMSCALHLAEAGRRVVLLEGREIGFGGAGRNVGLINAGLWLAPDDVSAALGPDHGERLLKLLGEGPAQVMALIDRHGIDCELERNGTLHCAVGASGLAEIREREAQWQKRGAPVKLLDATETAARLGTSAYLGALHDARAGTLQPLAYARGLATAVVKAGVTLHTSSPVITAERKGDRWRLTTPGGTVDADWVVVATDAYSAGPWQMVRNEQVHLPYFNLATQPLSPDQLRKVLPRREGVWDTKTVLSSFRLDRAGRLVFGSVGALRNSGTAIHKAWARRALSRLYPELGDIAFEHEWYGQIGMTGDALPRFHTFGPNAVGFSGYNGRGIAPGTVFGRELALLITGEKTYADLPLPVSDVTPAPFRRGREAWYEAGAQLAHLV
ncbi:FAD-binding oxidoreductase [Aminobacter aminovorans]|uniref:NAD(P)/FAD-dependent oxidoreductase n=1 Tax=Aminobacter aminovorans TaxID=83263 RepID=UPI00285E4A6D|nr:FAD-binding oxidoreductase [Aminobacter aminovorans]MDR7219889.1 glycine/D-amino acid oxidase-like deaminating enzyme [Aminobacter aminovorans]